MKSNESVIIDYVEQKEFLVSNLCLQKILKQ
jgi:hypothetical protein